MEAGFGGGGECLRAAGLHRNEHRKLSSWLKHCPTLHATRKMGPQAPPMRPRARGLGRDLAARGEVGFEKPPELLSTSGL